MTIKEATLLKSPTAIYLDSMGVDVERDDSMMKLRSGRKRLREEMEDVFSTELTLRYNRLSQVGRFLAKTQVETPRIYSEIKPTPGIAATKVAVWLSSVSRLRDDCALLCLSYDDVGEIGKTELIARPIGNDDLMLGYPLRIFHPDVQVEALEHYSLIVAAIKTEVEKQS